MRRFSIVRAACSLGFLAAMAAPASAADALPTDPIATVRYLFGKSTTEEAKALTTGELGEIVSRNGSPLNPNLMMENIAVIGQDDKATIVSAELPALPDHSNGYVFLTKEDGRWKVEALRTLDLPPDLIKRRISWEQASAQQRQEAFKGKDPKVAAEYETAIASIRLAMQPDRALAAFFNDHKGAFQDLQARLAKGGLSGQVSVANLLLGQLVGWNDAPDADERNAMAKTFVDLLLAGGVSANLGAPPRDKPRCGDDCSMYAIYEEQGRSVGYVWIGPKGKVPAMSPVNFILMQPLGEGWYLYKMV